MPAPAFILATSYPPVSVFFLAAIWLVLMVISAVIFIGAGFAVYRDRANPQAREVDKLLQILTRVLTVALVCLGLACGIEIQDRHPDHWLHGLAWEMGYEQMLIPLLISLVLLIIARLWLRGLRKRRKD